MKRNFFTSFFAVALLIGLGLGVTSCSNDDYLRSDEIQRMIDQSLNGQWKIVNITVKKDSWNWVDDAGQYEAVVDLPELTQSIFDEGAVIAYIKLDSKTKATLPFVKSYSFEVIDDDGVKHSGTYTEHIKCDFQVGSPSSVAFFIEASDLARADQYLEDKNFQVVLIW